ncbi:MAG TPA: hypothetical protein VF472_21405 [Burkholderiaceae bacterium]
MKSALTTILLACAALLAANTAAAQAAAPGSASNTAAAGTPKSKKASRKAVKKAPAAGAEEDEPEPDVSTSAVYEYQCELGAKLTVFQNKDDSDHVALKWGKRVHRLTRIPTTTGADRFENKHYGLVWIAIPAKGILLDSKTGHELTNECHTPEQQVRADAPKGAAG